MLQELLESHDYAGQILDKYIDNFVVAEDQEIREILQGRGYCW